MKSPRPIAINAAIILKKKSVHADHSGVCDIFSAERKKRGRGPFHPVQYGQKSVLNLYMIRKKMHLLQSKRSKSPYYAQYFALPQVEHVTLIFVPITSRVTGKCCRWCIRIQPVKWDRISPVNWARRRCIRNKMRMKCDTPLIAIKIGHIRRQKRNRQIKRVTSNTPKSCRKISIWCWCKQGEDQPARCAKKKTSAS